LLREFLLIILVFIIFIPAHGGATDPEPSTIESFLKEKAGHVKLPAFFGHHVIFFVKYSAIKGFSNIL
jgi:hypothetical protein